MVPQDDLTSVAQKPFAEAFAKLEELLVQSNRAFLIGAGCSRCAGLPLTGDLTSTVLASSELDGSSKAILTSIRDLFDGASRSNIEDYLSELIDFLAIADRRTTRGAKANEVTLGGTAYCAAKLREAADQVKRGIAQVIEKNVSIETHQRFVRAIHRPLRPGKPLSSQSVDYLVLNYDTVFEDALALERLPYSDGTDGGATGWWSPATFERNGLAARVYKLHGSINWCEFADDPLPRRIAGCLEVAAARNRRILIWPASTKYRETQLDPYAQLMERARGVLRPIQGSQCVLVICGYGFCDAHINLELDHALRESAGQLTVAVFTAEDEPAGQLEKWYTDTAVTEQVLIFANKGYYHGVQSDRATRDLLWWKFENLTRLLGGEK